MNFPNLNSIEEFYQEQCSDVGSYAFLIEAKEMLWEYNNLIAQQSADDFGDENIPDEIYTLTDSWF